jgi:hypothetical protein
MWTLFFWLRIGKIKDIIEDGNKLPGSIKSGEFFNEFLGI